MKKHKLISLGLSGILLLSSFAAGCSKESKDSARSQTSEQAGSSGTSEDAETTEPENTEETAENYLESLPDIPQEYWDSLNYADDFKGKIQIGNRDDLYTDSPDIIKDGFVTSDDYGYIFPYVDKRELTDVTNADTSTGEVELSDFSMGCTDTYDFGFCTADGTRITEPIYKYLDVMTDYTTQTALTDGFSSPYMYAVTDKNDKLALISLDGSKATDFCYDFCDSSTNTHSDWVLCYQIDEKAQTTVITVYDKDLNQVMEPITLDFLNKCYFPDGNSVTVGVQDVLDDKHVLIYDYSGEFENTENGYIYNLETKEKIEFEQYIPLSDETVILAQDYHWFISDFDGNHLTDLFDYCVNDDTISDYVYFSNDAANNRTSVFDTKGNLLSIIDTSLLGIMEFGDYNVSQSGFIENKLALYDIDQNFVEYREGFIEAHEPSFFDKYGVATLPGEEYEDTLYEVSIGDRNYNDSELILKAKACEDGFYYFEGGYEDYNPDKGYGVFEKGYVKEATIGDQSFIIYDKHFEPVYKVKNGALGFGLKEGRLIWGLVTDEDFIDLSNGEHIQIEAFDSRERWNYDETDFENGSKYISELGIVNKDGDIILAFRNSPYQLITDPITNKHYIAFIHNDKDFTIPDFAQEEYYKYSHCFGGPNRMDRLYCVEDEAFVNIDLIPDYHDIVTIIDSKLELSVNNNCIEYLRAGHEGYQFNNDNKGAYEIYDISDPADPQLLFHYNETDNIVVNDKSQ